MAQYQTDALVLGVKNWGEADKIVTLLSKEHGKIVATAFGCRRPKSPLAGALQMFNEVSVQLTKGERLDTVRQATLKQANKTMSADFSAMAYGAFVAELATNLAVERFPQGDMCPLVLAIQGLALWQRRISCWNIRECSFPTNGVYEVTMK